MDIQSLSSTYNVTVLNQSDIPAIWKLCSGNPQYYQHCPPAVTEESINKDMQAMPLKYPNNSTAFIGFFMLHADKQGKGIGSEIITEVCSYLKKAFSFIRLGYVKGNKQSERFWIKNSFQPTGVVAHTENYDIVIMQKAL